MLGAVFFRRRGRRPRRPVLRPRIGGRAMLAPTAMLWRDTIPYASFGEQKRAASNPGSRSLAILCCLSTALVESVGIIFGTFSAIALLT